MTGNLITVDKNTYESLEKELIELRQRVIRNNLKYSQEQIDLLIEYTPAAIAIFDRQMQYQLVNRRWREDYGLGDENIIGRSHYEIFPDVSQDWRKIHQRCLAGDIEKSNKDAFLRANGQTDWVKWEIYPWYEDSGAVGGIIMFTEVITASKQAEIALANSERRFRDIAANLPGAIFQFTIRNGVWGVDYISDFIWELAGITAAAMIEDLNSFFARLHPEDFDSLVASVEDAVAHSTPWHYEGRLVKPNGEILWWRGDSTPMQNEQQEVIFCGVLMDITEIKQKGAELKKLNEELEARVEERTAALRQAEERWQRLADNVPGMLYEFSLDLDGTMSFPFVSSGCREILELEPEEVQKDATLVFKNIHPDDFPDLHSEITHSAQTLQNCEYEWRTLAPSGQYKWIKSASRPERQADGEIIWYGCMVDITDRKQAEEKLQEQAQFLQSIWENVDYGIYVLDVINNGEEFRYVKFNPAILRTSPIPLASFPGKIMAEVLPTDIADIYRDHYRECVESGKSILLEESFSVNDKETWWLLNITPLFDNALRIDQLVVTVTDITERKQAEQDRQMFVSLIENSNDLIGCASLEGECLFINESGLKLVGVKSLEVAQRFNLLDYFLPEDREEMQMQIIPTAMERGLWQGEYRLRHLQTDEAIPIEMNLFVVKSSDTGEPLCLASITRDITERKQAEIKLQQQTQDLENTLYELQRTQSQLIHSEKMSSLGNMVAGIAHEINNPVNFIHGNLSPASQYVQDLLRLIKLYELHFPHPPEEIKSEIAAIDLKFLKEDLIKLLNSMQVGTDRIREIVLSLRNFSRLDEAEFKQVNIHEGLDSTLMILQNRLKARPHHPEILVIKEYGRIPAVQCYPGQLNQVFMNILSNAIDVLEEVFVGDKRQINIITEIVNTNRIAIRIADNGQGISQKTLDKVFDPFFTTKEVGKGTGLGLSISYQIIVDKHRGHLSCNSIPGEGAEFVIEIPIRQ
ncbi:MULTISPECIES: PAS domain S-box protein [unclassified Nodularia (in: cyanobacteria)]|uniref:PAS domain S-box protein n=1 Tax=unclassified Nodularia (in: cyanobacteria) TaxID=2656917 RepID=UPI001D1078BC|nr:MULTISPECIES: PAS domain S-box protein [unclassified Nodularia (in: cyanobacteria)]